MDIGQLKAQAREYSRPDNIGDHNPAGREKANAMA